MDVTAPSAPETYARVEVAGPQMGCASGKEKRKRAGIDGSKGVRIG
jgi:hypothetical protein